MDILGIAGNVRFSAAVSTIKDLLVAAVKSGADLCGAKLHGADLYGADLHGANLRGADLRGANLYVADLHGANLRGADLRGADLRVADLHGAKLHGADLHGANLYGADLHGADLHGDDGNKQKTAAMKVFSGLYRYEVWAVLFEDGSRWIRMGCLWKSLEKWDEEGVRNSNPSEFPDDGSEVCEDRVAAFEFAKAAVLRMKLPESVEVAK